MKPETRNDLEAEIITLKKRVKELEALESELKKNKAKYKDLYRMVRLMCDNVPDLIWAKDLEKRFLFTNHAMAKKLLNAADTQEPLGKTDMYFAQRERKKHPDNSQWHDFGEICRDSDDIILENKKPERFAEYGNIKGQYLYFDVYKAPFWDEKGKMIGLVGSARDVTNEKEIENALIESNELFHTLVESMLDATLIIDWDGTILFANPATFELVGADINVEIGHFKVMDFAHPDYVESIIKHQELVKKGKGGFFAEYQFQTLLGEDKWVEGLGTKIKFQGRSANLVTLRDITERKKFEDQLTNSLKEKEILIQEIHHRVKNNLQIISSLLNLQTRFTDDKDTYNQLMESQSRIMAMAMIHETLYQSHNIASLDFGEYIDKLCKQLFQTYYAETRVQLDITIKNTNLSINTAIPLGLILTELVINSLKYAFPEYGNGTITISINEAGSEYQLVIADDGIGFPADIDPENTDTLGLKLVHTLVNQIDGSVEMDSTSGTKYIISFEKDDH